MNPGTSARLGGVCPTPAIQSDVPSDSPSPSPGMTFLWPGLGPLDHIIVRSRASVRSAALGIMLSSRAGDKQEPLGYQAAHIRA